MKVVNIPKGNGKFRTIYVPSEEEMKSLRAALPGLTELQEKCDIAGVQHGFYRNRSPLTNAIQHIGFRYTLKMDLKDFFDTVTPSMFKNWNVFYKDNEWFKFFVDGSARQGLPTSPLIANMAASDMDEKIVALSRRNGRFDNRFVYTRYADDLTFSFDSIRVAGFLKVRVSEIIKENGFVLNEKKTKLQCAAAGRRIITGVAIDDAGAHPTRRMKRNLRAAKHQGRIPQVHGLTEWVKLRMPKGYVKPVSRVKGHFVEAVEATAQVGVDKIVNWVKRRFSHE